MQGRGKFVLSWTKGLGTGDLFLISNASDLNINKASAYLTSFMHHSATTLENEVAMVTAPFFSAKCCFLVWQHQHHHLDSFTAGSACECLLFILPFQDLF